MEQEFTHWSRYVYMRLVWPARPNFSSRLMRSWVYWTRYYHVGWRGHTRALFSSAYLDVCKYRTGAAALPMRTRYLRAACQFSSTMLNRLGCINGRPCKRGDVRTLTVHAGTHTFESCCNHGCPATVPLPTADSITSHSINHNAPSEAHFGAIVGIET